LKGQRDFRNYLAGAALAFGVVLLFSQVLQLMYGGLAPADRESVYSLIMNVYLASHLAGGFLGGYLVARVRRADYIMTGTVTAVLAYIFEFVYNLVVEATLTDIYAMVSLLIGAIIGAMFLRAKLERERIAGLRKTEEPKLVPESPEKPQT
jgi:LytS/YehU family sensor histidine kinase